MNPTIRAVLIAARAKIADPSRWTQGDNARDARGKWVYPKSNAAVCWCVHGAVCAEQSDLSEAPYQFLRAVAKELFGTNPVMVNDDLGHAAVLKLLDTAIAKCPR